MVSKATKKEKTADILKRIGQHPTQPLVVAELLEQLMAVWGGPTNFANAFFTEFKSAHAGGVVRARMLSDIFRLFQAHTASLKGPTNAVEGMTDEELQATLHDFIGDEKVDGPAKADPPPTPDR